MEAGTSAKRFTELGREEKGEGGDRGDLVEKKTRAAPGKSGLHARGEGERVLLDCSLPLWTLLFLHQVTSISSLPLLFSTQLCESLCVFQTVENHSVVSDAL